MPKRAKRLLWSLSPSLFDRLVDRSTPQEFAIGIYRGDTPLTVTSTRDIRNPVLTRDDINDEPAAFVADPFIFFEQDRWFMFFEIMSAIDRRGFIGLAISDEGAIWRYQGAVLREGFHLAYPQVFRWQSQIYMIPDTPSEGILLYEASNFPMEWTFVSELRHEPIYSDSSIFEHQGHLWMLTCQRGRDKADMSLGLFGSKTLTGPWVEHPQSPVVTGDSATTRPAGRIVHYEGRPIRFTQDCSSVYGRRVRAFEILHLDEHRYQEREATDRPILDAGDDFWNASGMHHVDTCPFPGGGWIAAVDGWRGAVR